MTLTKMLNDSLEYRFLYVRYLKRVKHISLPQRLFKTLPRQTIRELLKIWMHER